MKEPPSALLATLSRDFMAHGAIRTDLLQGPGSELSGARVLLILHNSQEYRNRLLGLRAHVSEEPGGFQTAFTSHPERGCCLRTSISTGTALAGCPLTFQTACAAEARTDRCWSFSASRSAGAASLAS